jgi:hypothetical protein
VAILTYVLSLLMAAALGASAALGYVWHSGARGEIERLQTQLQTLPDELKRAQIQSEKTRNLLANADRIRTTQAAEQVAAIRQAGQQIADLNRDCILPVRLHELAKNRAAEIAKINMAATTKPASAGAVRTRGRD